MPTPDPPDLDDHRARLHAAIDDARAAGVPPGALVALLDEAAAVLRADMTRAEPPDAAPRDAGPPDAALPDAEPPDKLPGAGPADAEPAAPERTAKIGPVTMFTEMGSLERAGRHGWKVVGSGSAMHVVVHTGEQWEYRRVFASRGTGRALEADGWQRFSSGWFPWGYYQRPTGRPPEEEQLVGGFLVEP